MQSFVRSHSVPNLIWFLAAAKSASGLDYSANNTKHRKHEAKGLPLALTTGDFQAAAIPLMRKMRTAWSRGLVSQKDYCKPPPFKPLQKVPGM